MANPTDRNRKQGRTPQGQTALGRTAQGGKDEQVLVQLATRIPKGLHREVKLFGVKNEVSLMDFVRKALEDKLEREAAGRKTKEHTQTSRSRRISSDTRPETAPLH